MKKNRGFTLLELIVILAVLGGIILLVMPAIRKAREHGQMVKCANNIRELSMAALIYASDHDGKIPDIAPDASGSNPNLANSDYVKDKAAYMCPRDHRSEEEFGSFKTSYTAFFSTPASIYDASSERVMFIESDQAGVSNRSDIDVSDVSYRHSGLAVFAYGDGHVATYYREQFLIVSKAPEVPTPPPEEPKPPQPPTANFSTYPVSFTTDGLEVEAWDESTGDIDSRWWEFGNGSGGSGESVSYTYMIPKGTFPTPATYTITGTSTSESSKGSIDPKIIPSDGYAIYIITLTVTGPGGSDSMTKVVYVYI